MCDYKKRKVGNRRDDKKVSKVLNKETYRSINLSREKLKKITVTPKIKDGKMLFDRKNKDHRYIMRDD